MTLVYLNLRFRCRKESVILQFGKTSSGECEARNDTNGITLHRGNVQFMCKHTTVGTLELGFVSICNAVK
jgi:hypothetical protein